MRGFHCANSIHVYSVSLTSSPTPLILHSPSLRSSFSNCVWWVWLCCVHMYICSTIWSSLPLRILLFALLSPTDAPANPPCVPHIHSCPIIIIIIILLGLVSTNERKQVIFGFLSLVSLAQHDDLHPFSSKWHNFSFLYGWVIFNGTYLYIVCTYMYIIFSLFHLSVLGHFCWLHIMAFVQLPQTCLCRYLSCMLLDTPSDICQEWPPISLSDFF
jgi:hypothetical protein